MNTQQQAYINGFVKRASEYGLSQNEAFELLKSAAPQVAAGVQDPHGFLDPKVQQFPPRALPAAIPPPPLVPNALRHVPGTDEFEQHMHNKLQEAAKKKFPDHISLR